MEVIILIAFGFAFLHIVQKEMRRARRKIKRSMGIARRPRLAPKVRPSPRQLNKTTPPTFDKATSTPVTEGRVIEGPAFVIDGDSIVIKKTQVRLFGVDAPEINHPYGKKAKWAMMALCKGQQIRAEIVEEDAHGRTVAQCFLPDGRDLSAELVKQGLAIDWPKFSGGKYRGFEVPDARKRMWLADARQKGRMHVWEQYEYDQMRKSRN